MNDKLLEAAKAAKILAHQLSVASFNAGVEDAGDAWKRQEKTAIKQNQTLASLLNAISALAAQAEPSPMPDMRHPKIQALIGAKARREIELRIAEDLLDDPKHEISGTEGDYWYSLHDKIVELQHRAQFNQSASAPPSMVHETIDFTTGKCTSEPWPPKPASMPTTSVQPVAWMRPVRSIINLTDPPVYGPVRYVACDKDDKAAFPVYASAPTSADAREATRQGNHRNAR